jgi:hypothetical protein
MTILALPLLLSWNDMQMHSWKLTEVSNGFMTVSYCLPALMPAAAVHLLKQTVSPSSNKATVGCLPSCNYVLLFSVLLLLLWVVLWLCTDLDLNHVSVLYLLMRYQVALAILHVVREAQEIETKVVWSLPLELCMVLPTLLGTGFGFYSFYTNSSLRTALTSLESLLYLISIVAWCVMATAWFRPIKMIQQTQKRVSTEERRISFGICTCGATMFVLFLLNSGCSFGLWGIHDSVACMVHTVCFAAFLLVHFLLDVYGTLQDLLECKVCDS